MKRMSKLLVTCLIAVMMLTMSGCGCKHENVAVDAAVAATCTGSGLTEGKHCADCGKVIVPQETVSAIGHTEADVEAVEPTCDTDGHTAGKMCSVCDASLSGMDKIGALGHTWKDATCDAPKTCSVCDKTEGKKLEHDWTAATCDKAKTCKLCAKTDGKALGHKWEEATTEAPKTCSVCKKTSGSKLKTDSRFTTAATKHLQGTWVGDTTITDNAIGEVAMRYTLQLGNTGKLTESVEVKDEKAYRAKLKQYTIDMMYDSFAQEGMSKAQADEAMLEAYGLNVNDYVEESLKSVDINDIYSAFTREEVYYVEGDTIYTGLSWSAKFEGSAYTLKDGKLTIDGLIDEAGEPMVLTKK